MSRLCLVTGANGGVGGVAIALLAAQGDAAGFEQSVIAGKADGAKEWIYDGYRMTIFSDEEEAVFEASLKGDKLRYYPAQAMARAGDTASPVELKAIDAAWPLVGQLTLKDGRKLGFISPHLIPRLAVCDPALTLGLPAWLTAASSCALSGAPGANCSRAVSLAKLTVALTPGWRLSTFSMRVAQVAQVMPSISSCSICGGTLKPACSIAATSWPTLRCCGS